ncbi:MAG: Lpg1974 family pore-forming outer membrane protein [Waddliaceae bacterium]
MTRFSMKHSVLAGIASALCLMTGTVQADQDYNYGSYPCEPCETCPDRCFSTCCEDDQCGLFVGSDLLFWTACQKNLNCVITSTVTSEGPVATEFNRHVVDYDWTVGYRIFGGYRMGVDNWEIAAVFTHWDNDASGTIIDFDGATIDANRHCKVELDYDVIDILLARSYQLGCDSQLKPFIGFRGVWLDQDWKSTEQLTTPQVPLREFHSSLFARGLHAGSTFQWDGCEGFGLWATVGASLLEADVHNKQEVNFQPTNPPSATSTLKEKYCLPFVGYNLGFGIDYECCFFGCEGETIIRLGLGYEFQNWFSTPEPVRDFIDVDVATPDIDAVHGVSTGGALMLHGVTFRVGYYF